jgi:hypothetical protein
MKDKLQYLWPTPFLHINLIDEGIVSKKLHVWLDRYAEKNSRRLKSDIKGFTSHEKRFVRYDLSVFQSPRLPELRQIKKTLAALCDDFIEKTAVNPLPKHKKTALMWFVIQNPNNAEETVSPHYHEGSDVAFAYYLSVPKDESGKIVFLDPRGGINRGGMVIPKHHVFLSITPKPGDLVMFPRYLYHYSTLNTDRKTKKKVLSGSVCYDRVD